MKDEMFHSREFDDIRCLIGKNGGIGYNGLKAERSVFSMKSLLIKDTTREERIKIVQQGLFQCGSACDFCNGCDNLGGGSVDAYYQPYIDGEKELRELNEQYRPATGLVR